MPTMPTAGLLLVLLVLLLVLLIAVISWVGELATEGRLPFRPARATTSRAR